MTRASPTGTTDMGKLLGESSITVEDFGTALTEAAEAFVETARKFQMAAQNFSRIAKILGAEDE